MLVLVALIGASAGLFPSCGSTPAPSDEHLQRLTKATEALSDELRKITDEASADQALSRVGELARGLARARGEFISSKQTDPSAAARSSMQGPAFLAATARLQQEMMRLAQIPGMGKLLQAVAAGSGSSAM